MNVIKNNPGDFFVCKNCGRFVEDKPLGTKNRNHCPFCLWSQHLDEKIPGDRKSSCQGKMEPIAVCFKKSKFDKYKGKERGELMIVHRCLLCNRVSWNRIAGDDDPQEIWKIYLSSFKRLQEIQEFLPSGLDLALPFDEQEVKNQLFGKEVNLGVAERT